MSFLLMYPSAIVPYRNAIVTAGGSIVGSKVARAGYNMARSWLRSGRNRAGRGRRVAVSQRQRNSRSYTQTQQRRKRTKSGSGVTTQQDRRLQYVRHPMPKFKKRRWKKFVKSVQAVNEKDLGTRQVVFNILGSATNAASNEQAYFQTSLYSGKSAQSYLNDLYYMGSLENSTAAPTGAAGNNVWASTKFLFTSACLDITIRNVSGKYDAGLVLQPTSEAKLELDVYEISLSKPAEYFDGAAGVSLNNLNDLFNYSLAQQQALTDENPGTDPKADHYRRGVTPWDNSYALSKFGIKIWKKTKYFIPNGDTITYQIRDPRRHVITRKDMGSISGFNRPGLSRHLWIIGKLVPGLTQSGVVLGGYAPSFNIGMTRKYVYKVEGITDDRSLYQNI